MRIVACRALGSDRRIRLADFEIALAESHLASPILK
jgi:hypothetical protein